MTQKENGCKNAVLAWFFGSLESMWLLWESPDGTWRGSCP